MKRTSLRAARSAAKQSPFNVSVIAASSRRLLRHSVARHDATSDMNLRPLLNLNSDRLFALPMAILYITDKCNSRCISCDYWRYGRTNMSLELIERLAEELPRIGTRYILLSGGEPLMHPQWNVIAQKFKMAGMKIGMVTSGIMLPKYADKVSELIDELFVSLDGAMPETYHAIRGVDGLGLIERGVRELAGKLPITFRTTVQRGNFREIPALLRLTRSWHVAHHSFLAVDVTTHAAFARQADFEHSMALAADDLTEFDRVLAEIETEFETEFRSGYIAESPAKLRKLRRYFAALLGLGDFPAVRCNAPRWSTVIETDGSLKPCYFLPAIGKLNGGSILSTLNEPGAIDLRHQQRVGEREECSRCVCSAHKGARELISV
jgi:Fe-coproporphyrin III synthase